MNKLIWLDISMESSLLLEDIMDNQILKETPYSSKYKKPVLEYHNVFLPYDENIIPGNFFNEYIESMKWKISLVNNFSEIETDNIILNLTKCFKSIINSSKTLKIIVHNIIDSDVFGISYTDGSFSKNIGKAGYGCCKLTESNNDGLFDSFSNQRYLFETFSGSIDDGTNNIGELTAIKTAIENLSEKKFQIIISDSIYGIKTYREYIHVWKNNNYKTYSKQPIKNKDLIIETFEKIKKINEDGKIIVFAWTKGHANNEFNEKCDDLAKGAIGL